MRDPEAQAERVRLIEAYGYTEMLPRSPALLRTLGCDHDDAIVVRYPCTESARGFADLNRRRWGHRALGPFVTESGVLGVIDYRETRLRLEREGRRRRGEG